VRNNPLHFLSLNVLEKRNWITTPAVLFSLVALQFYFKDRQDEKKKLWCKEKVMLFLKPLKAS
jgi:hypothetical protein